MARWWDGAKWKGRVHGSSGRLADALGSGEVHGPPKGSRIFAGEGAVGSGCLLAGVALGVVIVLVGVIAVPLGLALSRGFIFDTSPANPAAAIPGVLIGFTGVALMIGSVRRLPRRKPPD
jgi:hypothetical protein